MIKGDDILNFASMITQTGNDFILYNNEKIYIVDKYNLNGKHKVKFTFVSTNSLNEQCIVLSLFDVKCDIFCNNKKYAPPKTKFPTLDIFEKYFGKEFILDIDLQEGHIGICNGSIMKAGETELVTYFSRSCAMKIEELSPTKKRYYCNDYENDDDFDDLVFELEILD